MKIDADLLMKLSDALKLLPNVKPRLAREHLDNVFFDLCVMEEKGEHREICPGLSVASSGMNDLFIRDDGGVPRINPAGAALLLRLYEGGFFSSMMKKGGIQPSTALREYTDSQAAVEEAQRKRMAEQEAYRNLVKNPAGVTESQFSYRLLNDVFITHRGFGEGELEIGGIKVRKVLIRYTSNSGKSADWTVSYSWTSADGTSSELTKESIFKKNRRNDPDRDWGLPE